MVVVSASAFARARPEYSSVTTINRRERESNCPFLFCVFSFEFPKSPNPRRSPHPLRAPPQQHVLLAQVRLQPVQPRAVAHVPPTPSEVLHPQSGTRSDGGLARRVRVQGAAGPLGQNYHADSCVPPAPETVAVSDAGAPAEWAGVRVRSAVQEVGGRFVSGLLWLWCVLLMRSAVRRRRRREGVC